MSSIGLNADRTASFEDVSRSPLPVRDGLNPQSHPSARRRHVDDDARLPARTVPPGRRPIAGEGRSRGGGRRREGCRNHRDERFCSPGGSSTCTATLPSKRGCRSRSTSSTGTRTSWSWTNRISWRAPPRGRYIAESALVRLRRDLELPELSPAHRLDRVTAGLLLFTVHQAARRDYQTMFAERRVAKEYEAIARHDAQVSTPRGRA